MARFGGFNSHLANPREPEASAPTLSHDIDKLADDLGKIRLSDLIGNHESESGFTRLLLMTGPAYLENDLDNLLQLRAEKRKATSCSGKPQSTTTT
jgi:hypothetical protein